MPASEDIAPKPEPTAPEAVAEKPPPEPVVEKAVTELVSSSPPASTAAEAPPVVPQPVPPLLKINAILAILVCAPWLYLHAQRLWASAHYQFFPIVLLGAGVLAFRGWKGIGPLQPGSSTATWLLLGIGFLLIFGASIPLSPLIASVGTLFLLLGIIWALGGKVLLRRMLPAWIFLWLTIPLPWNMDTWLITQLQTLTAKTTSKVLDLFRVIHVMAGNVVEVPGKRLLVEQACSGIHSLFSVLTCVLFFILWAQPSVLRSLFLVTAGLFWVLLNNTTRVVVIVWVYTRYGYNLSEGLIHDILGGVLFAITLGLIISSDRLYLFFTSALPIGSRSRKPAESATEGPATRLPDLGPLLLGRVPITMALAVLALLQVGLFWASAEDLTPAHDVLIARLEGLSAETLPAQVGNWRRVQYDTKALKVLEAIKEVKCRTWTYQMGSVKALLSVDYPFTGWHELCLCYQGQGWDLLDRTAHPAGEEAGAGDFAEVKLQKPLDRFGYLYYGLVDQQGELVPPPEQMWMQTVAVRMKPYQNLLHRLGLSTAPGGVQTNRSACQVQLFVESFQALGPPELAQTKNLFLQARAGVRKQLLPE